MDIEDREIAEDTSEKEKKNKTIDNKQLEQIKGKLQDKKENKEFLDELIEYYINEAQSYREMAQEYSPKTNSVVDTAFGLIIGCVYSSFLQVYSNQQQTPSSEDIQEFREIIMINSRMIKDAIIQKSDSMLET